MNRIELDARLAELGIELQPPKAAIANYVPTVLAGGFLHISGQVAFKDGKPYALGQVGQEISDRLRARSHGIHGAPGSHQRCLRGPRCSPGR
jgi:enamine deaminase RidA (YjgF/YER057c/UK114 family)